MTDILVRICVGACGLMTISLGVVGTADKDIKGTAWAFCVCLLLFGLITILRALGVL